MCCNAGPHADTVSSRLDETRVDVINDMIHWLITASACYRCPSTPLIACQAYRLPPHARPLPLALFPRHRCGGQWYGMRIAALTPSHPHLPQLLTGEAA